MIDQPRTSRRRKKTEKGLLVAVAFGLLISSAAFAEPPPRPARSHELPALPAWLKEEMQELRIPGMQVAVVRDGKIVFSEAFGLADVENEVPVTKNTRFQIASCTKAFTGVAIMQLVEDGKLDLSDPVSRYLPELPAAWRAVTVRQIATHTSGIPNIAPGNTLRLVGDSGEIEDAWAKVQTLPMEFTPGERASYNQTGYMLLGKLIDRLSGEAFPSFIQRRQFDVVGMPRTLYGDDREVVRGSARTYTPYVQVQGRAVYTDTLHKVHIEIPPPLRAIGGLITTAEEFARWTIALQQERLLKNKSSLSALWSRGVLNNDATVDWAIGWLVFERARHPVYFSVGAGKSACAIYPDDGLTIIALTNLSSSMPVEFLDKIAAFYLPDLAQPASTEPAAKR